MAVNLVATVGLEIDQLKKKIAGASSQLVSLRNELKKRESIYLMLGERQKTRKRLRKTARGRRRATVDWSQVLNGVPNTFTIDHVVRRGGARSKSRAYLRQVIVRWGREGKIKRTGRGRYQKV